MRTLTEEQKQKRDARRARMRALASEVSKMSEEQRAALAARCPIVTIEGRALSVYNQCMIAMQIPAATVVGGFRQWLGAGRAVTKGEHGAGIWVPLGKKDEQGEIQLDDERRFIIATVFDVSQTHEVEQGVTA